MIFLGKPEYFNEKMEVVSCFLEHEGKIILLHRQDHKPQGDTWGVPAGKIEKNESAIQAIIREVGEETGILLKESELLHFRKVFVRYAEFDFIYHIFSSKLKEKPKVKISKEAFKGFEWVRPEKALEMNVIQDLDACIKLFYKI